MPYRRIVFANNEYYHIYNRSVGTERIFSAKRNLDRALDLVDYYRFYQATRYSKYRKLNKKQKKQYSKANFTPKHQLIEILAYAVMPNHYHLLIKQVEKGGIRKCISDFQNSYAKYYNIKNRRHGSVFQNAFRAVWISSEEQLKHTSRYIHLNPITSYLLEIKALESSQMTSYKFYKNKELSTNRLVGEESVTEMINRELLFSFFRYPSAYYKFVKDQVDYQRNLGKIKSLLIDTDVN